ncbi:MAG: hypothetical protein JW751_22705 [Polyangiaceae bacterium]|nr:hypothetical protein [Polyangiaceae bacterium]
MDDRQHTTGFLAFCVAETTGNPILEEIRSRSAEAALAVFRVAKNSLVHAIDNDAMASSAEQSAGILVTFANEIGTPVTITFIEDTVFVCGQLLRASRKIYEATLELGKLLFRAGVSEVSFDAGLTKENLLEFAATFAAALRDPNRRKSLIEARVPNITIRRVERALTQRGDENDPVAEQILRLYAVALMVMRQYFDAVAHGVNALPSRVKRLSQKLVTLVGTGNPAVLGMTAMAHAHRDDAGRAVQSAILAVVLARQLTTDRLQLAALAMAALMAEGGRVRVAGPEGRDRLIALADADEMTVPPATAAVTIGTGGVNVTNALRTVAAFEANYLERQELLAPLYGGKSPLPQAQILVLVRRLLEFLAPRDATIRPLGPVDALAALATDSTVERSLVRILVRAVGIVPAGTVVEFETGEWAVVVGPSANPQVLHLPRVRLVTDGQGRAINPPREIDLGASAEARTLPRIKNVLDPQYTRFNLTQAFVAT